MLTSRVPRPAQRKLKVFRGTKMIVEHALLDQPVALCAFYTDEARAAPSAPPLRRRRSGAARRLSLIHISEPTRPY